METETQYGTAEVYGRKHLGETVPQLFSDGWRIQHIAFAGNRSASSIDGAIIKPSTNPDATVPVFILVISRDVPKSPSENGRGLNILK